MSLGVPNLPHHLTIYHVPHSWFFSERSLYDSHFLISDFSFVRIDVYVPLQCKSQHHEPSYLKLLHVIYKDICSLAGNLSGWACLVHPHKHKERDRDMNKVQWCVCFFLR